MIDFTLNAQNRPNLIDKIAHLDCSNQLWQVTIRPYKTKRSNAQNARYWAFLTAFGNHLGYTSEEVHELCKYKFLREYVTVNGEEMIKLKSTPKTNTKEFAEYCEACERWAIDNGFYWNLS